MKYIGISIVIVSFALVFPSFAAESTPQKSQPTVEEIQKHDQIDKAMEAIDKLEQLANSLAREKHSDCIKAYGNQKFCQCLSDNLPVPVSFMLYTKIVTTPKGELGYKDLNAEDKKIVDTTLNTREVCVNQK